MRIHLPVLILLLLLAASSGAEPVLDVEHDPPLGRPSQASAQLASVFDIAQSFTVGLDGVFEAVQIRLTSVMTAESLVVDLRPTDLDGIPLGDESVLASVEIEAADLPSGPPPWSTFDFSDAGIEVESGEVLAFVLSTLASFGEGEKYQMLSQTGGESYTEGEAFMRPGGSFNPFPGERLDLHFRTYVPEPSRRAAAAAILGSVTALAWRSRRAASPAPGTG